MIINLIATPRNVSTALMYSFAQHSEIKVMDEPFYAYYLSKTQADHPGKEEVLKELPIDLEEVFDLIEDTASQHAHVFIKNMAHHLNSVSDDQLSRFVNIFLTRDPKELIASFSKVIRYPSMRDIGVKDQWQRFERLTQLGSAPIIIDSGVLLENPKLLLSKLCQKLDLPFEQNILKWEAGPKAEDGSWAKYWYRSVHKSTGFQKVKKKDVILPAHCRELHEEAKIYYDRLSKYILTY